MTVWITRLFPLWAILAALLAFSQPGWFAGLKPAIVPLLGLVMFGMGVTLTGGNFLTVLQRPLPVLLGVVLNHFQHARLAAVRAVFPVVSVIAIVLIIAIIVALNHGQLAHVATGAVLAVMVHNMVGLLGGYWVPRWLGRDERECRTLAIEVGMQNSGLAVALAVKYFSWRPRCLAPCSASGIICPARIWRATGAGNCRVMNN